MKIKGFLKCLQSHKIRASPTQLSLADSAESSLTTNQFFNVVMNKLENLADYGNFFLILFVAKIGLHFVSP